jgi:hypothetical protein
MKKISIAAIIVIIVGFSAAMISSSFTKTPEAPLYIAPSVAALDHFVGDPVQVFELVPNSQSKVADFKNAAASANVNVSGVQVSGGANIEATNINANDPSAHFNYDAKSGALSFSQGIAEQLKGGNNLPSTEQAASVASQFLKANKMMAGDESQMEVQHVGGIKRVTQQGETDILKTVTYTRKIGGVPVSGSGSKIVVELGNNGKTLSVQRNWREINTAGAKSFGQADVSVKTQQQAEKELATIIRDIFGNTQYTVLSVQKMYFDNEGKYIQPVFLFEANVTVQNAGKTAVVPFAQPISMMKSPPESVGFNPAQLKAAAAQSGILQSKEGQKPVQQQGVPKRN